MASKKYDRRAIAAEIAQRTQESDDRKEGEVFNKYFKEDLDLPFVKFGTTKEDPHILDIIPFNCGGKMPDFMKLKEGKFAYYLDIYVHQNIGGGKAWIVCPQKNYGEPCPICEHIDELSRDGKEYEDYAEIAPKRRSVYNIINMSTVKEEKKGIQIWEVSHKYGEKAIQSAATNARGGGKVPFADPSTGQSIQFNVDNDTYKTVSGHKLVPRDYDISDEVLDGVFQLDQCINILSYKEIKNIFEKPADEEENADAGNEKEQPRGRGRSEEKDVDDARVMRNRPRDEQTSSRKPADNECPDGYDFGIDIDKVEACKKCSSYDTCSDEAKRLEDMLRDEKRSRGAGNAGSVRRGR